MRMLIVAASLLAVAAASPVMAGCSEDIDALYEKLETVDLADDKKAAIADKIGEAEDVLDKKDEAGCQALVDKIKPELGL